MNEAFSVKDLGQLDYKEAWKVQLETHRAVAEAKQSPTLLIVEHPAVITFGKKGGRENLLVKEDILIKKGFALYDIERGGDITYHGPGQIVAYPIFKVGRQVRVYLDKLERVVINLLADYGFEAVGSPGYAGVWVNGEKIASIGVAIKRNVSFHGLALNVNTDLNHFNYIVPCGLVGKQMTSLEKLLDKAIPIPTIKAELISQFRSVFSDETILKDSKKLITTDS